MLYDIRQLKKKVVIQEDFEKLVENIFSFFLFLLSRFACICFFLSLLNYIKSASNYENIL